MNNSLLPWTKVVLAVSAIVQLVVALIALFDAFVGPNAIQNFFWPPPFEPWPTPIRFYNAALYLAMSLVAAYALLQNTWSIARTYLAIAGLYVALSVVASIVMALRPPGVPTIVWLYVLLAILYLPQVVWVWRQQSART